jgi:hypothetical protein
MVLTSRENSIAVAVVGAAMALASAFVIYRLARSLSIEVYAESVVVRGLVRTLKLSRSDIARFIVEPGTNAEDEAASALAVRARNGRVTVFVDFRSDSTAGGISVESLAEQLNRLVAA